jgi:hypothetical protein
VMQMLVTAAEHSPSIATRIDMLYWCSNEKMDFGDVGPCQLNQNVPLLRAISAMYGAQVETMDLSVVMNSLPD